MNKSAPATALLDQQPKAAQFLADVLAGLRSSPKEFPCKYFYDERGSQLFDEICELDEYYLTRTEDEILKRHVQEMADQIGPGVMLVEYGSGSSTKTRTLLDHLADAVAYVPVDISREHLHRTADMLSRAYPQMEVLPVCADFTKPFTLPASRRSPTHSAVFFPGSTIGNFQQREARVMIKHLAAMCGAGGGLLIGIDLQKDPATIEAAYNDARGVTAEFNLNLLRRINRELDADFDVDQFLHRARYDERLGRIQMSLVSRRAQCVTVGAHAFELAPDEAIITEYSHKYTIEGFAAMAADARLTLRKTWTDGELRFAVLHFALLDEGAMIELQRVSKRYGERAAVDAVDLACETGKTQVLIGPSGCGKSTLLRMMVGLVVPDSGVVLFAGQPLSRETISATRQRIGYMIQEGGLFPHLSARDNVVLMPKYLNWPVEKTAARVTQLLELTRLTPELLDRFPRQLSGGQRQRVSLMRALMLDPDVLLLDEPLGDLDPMIRAELQQDLRTIFRELGKTVVLVTHDLAEAGYLADRIALLRSGRIVQQGALTELVERPAEEFVAKFVSAQRSVLA